MTEFPAYPTAPLDGGDPDHHRRQIARAANSAIAGKTNNLGEVTLTANAASTVIVDARLSFFSVIVFDPLTANAAAEIANGTLYVTEANRGIGSWTVTHANDANADKSFRYAILG